MANQKGIGRKIFKKSLQAITLNSFVTGFPELFSTWFKKNQYSRKYSTIKKTS